jgi:hypothetical protein
VCGINSKLILWQNIRLLPRPRQSFLIRASRPIGSLCLLLSSHHQYLLRFRKGSISQACHKDGGCNRPFWIGLEPLSRLGLGSTGLPQALQYIDTQYSFLPSATKGCSRHATSLTSVTYRGGVSSSRKIYSRSVGVVRLYQGIMSSTEFSVLLAFQVWIAPFSVVLFLLVLQTPRSETFDKIRLQLQHLVLRTILRMHIRYKHIPRRH